jgi:hypothetical protein
MEGSRLESDLRNPASVWLLPDPITAPAMLSAGSLLYFDAPLILTSPPGVVTEKSFALTELINERNPPWGRALLEIISRWSNKTKMASKIIQVLSPLRGNAFHMIYLSYNADDEALEESKQFIASSGWSIDRFLSSIDQDNACGELTRHIFLEKFLGFNENMSALYEYCDHALTKDDIPSLLAHAYGLRLLGFFKGVRNRPPFAITNPNLIAFFADLHGKDEIVDDHQIFEADAISLMVFNRLLQTWLDPISEDNIQVTAWLRESKRAEIDVLNHKCSVVSRDIDLKQKSDHIFAEIERAVRYETLPDVRDLLEIRDSIFQGYVEKLFSDRIFLSGLLGAISTKFLGSETLSAAGAIATLASMGATAVSHYRETRDKLKRSDYRLIYDLNLML